VVSFKIISPETRRKTCQIGIQILLVSVYKHLSVRNVPPRSRTETRGTPWSHEEIPVTLGVKVPLCLLLRVYVRLNVLLRLRVRLRTPQFPSKAARPLFSNSLKLISYYMLPCKLRPLTVLASIQSRATAGCRAPDH
jgi:hypothetical protein